MPEPERRRVLLDLIRTHAAAVLGESGPADIAPELGFVDLGFDSLANLELQDSLHEATGIELPSTLIFDYPTAAALADHLCAEFGTARSTPVGPALAELDRLEGSWPASPPTTRPERDHHRLRDLTSRWSGGPDDSTERADLGSATDDELFEVLDQLRTAERGSTSNPHRL
ncbi:acyl carrier protein [Streptacidiphilus sp. 4-A2]|nr:acyl carrier protein [Streptacidiphilus sp. 4-A2]